MNNLPAGTQLTCQFGHHIAKAARDLVPYESIEADDFTDWKIHHTVNGNKVNNRCRCGAPWRKGVQFYVEGGIWP